MNAKTITRFVIGLTVVLAALLGTAGAASAANPGPGNYSGNQCMNSGRLTAATYNVEGCFFMSNVSPGRVAVSAGVYDARSDGYYGRTSLTVQLLDRSGNVLATYTQSVTTSGGAGTSTVGNSFLVGRTSATYALRVHVGVQTLKVTTNSLYDSNSNGYTYLFTA